MSIDASCVRALNVKHAVNPSEEGEDEDDSSARPDSILNLSVAWNTLPDVSK